MKRSRIRCVLAGALLTLITPSLGRADSASLGKADNPPAEKAGKSYRVGPEDVLKIRVARHEELGTEAVIPQDGRVMLPVVGTLSVTGLSTEEIRDLVVQGLRKKLVHPDVSVDVIRPRLQRIYVSGAVKAPQILDWKDGWRITEALANAGGLLIRPEVARGTIFRLAGPDHTLKLDLARIYIDQDPAANLALQPGDVIDIQDPPTVRIYVTGQVQKPGMIDLPRGLGAVEALSLCGGQLANAALTRAYVQKSDGRKIPVDLARLLNHNGTTPKSNAVQPVAEGNALPAPSGVEATLRGHGAGLPAGDAPPAPGTDVTMEAGDQLVVPENVTKIAVLGKVTHASTFPLRDGEETTLADAISMAGGFDQHAQKSHVGIIRMVDGKQTVTEVDMNRLVKGKVVNPVLQDRDIVFVPETRHVDWAGRILPAVQAMAGAVFYLR